MEEFFAMIGLCALIWANVCVPQEYKHVTTGFSFVTREETFDPAESKRRGIELSVIDSDMIATVTTVGLNKACADGWCIYYRKQCDNGFRHCKYIETSPVAEATTIANQAVAQKVSIELTARSASQLRYVEKKIRLLVIGDDEQKLADMPLAAFDQLSGSLNTLGCPRERQRLRIPGCTRH
jgi:hypothetical protein